MPKVGQTFSHYRIVEKIGAGGMGEVYRARDVKLERDVAVKVLPSHLAEDSAALARFEREAKAIAALSHPNILSIFDVGCEGGIAYSVTELLEGETLRAQLADGALPVRKAIDYAAQMAQGLAAAHDKGITHRDLKPENVFVTADGRIKILDFGLAKQAEPTAAAGAADSPTRGTLTDPGIVMGTIAYMAPEQARGQAVDPRADIFSFGAVLHEMLTGRPVFRRETPTDTMIAILKEDAPELCSIDPKIPLALARLVQHCLEKNPAARYQSARDLAFALETLAGSSSIISGPTAVPAAPSRPWVRRLALAVIVLGLLAAAFLLGQHFTRPPRPGEVTFEQKTFDPQFISNARFLPEGKGIVFSAALEGNVPELFVIRAGDATPKPLNQPSTHLLSVSKKGDLAVLTDVSLLGQRLYRGTLAVMPLDGAPKPQMTNVREADWSPDGSGLAVIRDTGNSDQLEYPPDKVLHKSDGYLSDLRVSPDGNQVALFDHPARFDDRGDVIVVDRASGAVRKLAAEYWGLEGLAWMPDGAKVVFSAAKSNINELQPHAVAVSGSEPAHQALPTMGQAYIQDIASDGRWIITREDMRQSVGFRLPGEKSDQEFSWMKYITYPFLSSTERGVVFTDYNPSAGSNYAVLYLAPNATKPSRLGEGLNQGISPDGKWALAVIYSTPPQLVIHPIGAGSTIHLDRGPIENYRAWAQWFPDSAHILFCGNEASKPSRCYRQAIAGGPPIPVTPYGLSRALVAPDGHTLLTLDAEGTAQIISIEGGPSQAARGLTKDDFPIKLAADNHSVFVRVLGRLPARIEKVDLLSGERTPVGGEIAPADRAGLVGVAVTDIIQEGAGYAYVVRRNISALFVVQFAKQP